MAPKKTLVKSPGKSSGKLVAEAAVKPAAKVVAKPAAKVVAKPAAKVVAAAKAPAKVAAKPAAKVAAKPAVKPAAKPAAKVAAKPVAKVPAGAAAKAPVKAAAKAPAKPAKPAAKAPAKPADKPAAPAPASGDASGQAALDALAGAMAALKPAELRTPRLDARAAATHVLGLLERRLPESLRKRFVALPATEFSPETLTRARLSALGVLHTQTRLRTAEASDPSQQLSAVTLEEAAELRRRMLDLCEYHFKGNTPLGREIADIRSGHGYQDLAEDLERLARIYTDQAAIVRKDPVNYVASDAKDAARLHAQIRAQLGDRGAETPAAREQARRVWTLLDRLYGDIVQTGRWLLRSTPEEAEKLFPTLVQAVRRPTPVKKGAPQPAPAEPR